MRLLENRRWSYLGVLVFCLILLFPRDAYLTDRVGATRFIDATRLRMSDGRVVLHQH